MSASLIQKLNNRAIEIFEELVYSQPDTRENLYAEIFKRMPRAGRLEQFKGEIESGLDLHTGGYECDEDKKV